ncbi:FecCD family ABC transporter permease [Salsuginibacillus kocurii]|uniref:FecCD family ABC transporter permease n=1 Tax=Salsuginibacillus kocurii TaxID=427078 RepID=UPI0003753B10|nr:iron ABC transporter permease [Salsuginibacillus kocurii]
MNKYMIFRNRFVSGKVEKKPVAFIALLVLFLCFSMVIGLSVGSTWISPLEVLQHLFGAESINHAFTIDVLRLPRMVLALLVGASLGVAGLILQEMVRNPLAAPDIIGITSGASVAAVTYIALFSGVFSLGYLPLAAMAGAGLVSIMIYLLAWRNGVTPIRLVLIGIGVAAVMDALTTMMIVFSPINTTSQAYTWLTGSVYGTSWEDVTAMAPWVLIIMPLAFLCTRAVYVQQFGDDVAMSLGAKIQAQRFCMILISVGLAGLAVAYAGGVGFVGLMAPHIGRFFVGRSFAALVPVSALIGGWMVISADVIARTAFLPLDLPVGVLISGIGAPFFLYLLYRNRRR